MEHKNSWIVDLKSIFSDFRNSPPKFYQKILLIILILRAKELFSFKHGALFCCSLCQAKTEVSQSFLDFKGIFLKHFKLFDTKNFIWFHSRQTVGKCKNTISVDLWFLFATKVQYWNTLAANIGPCNLKLVLEQCVELWLVRYTH